MRLSGRVREGFRVTTRLLLVRRSSRLVSIWPASRAPTRAASQVVRWLPESQLLRAFRVPRRLTVMPGRQLIAHIRGEGHALDPAERAHQLAVLRKAGRQHPLEQ